MDKSTASSGTMMCFQMSFFQQQGALLAVTYDRVCTILEI
jgi:hypothetical protein